MGETWQDDDAADEIMSKLSSEDILFMFTVRMETIEKSSDSSLVMKYYNFYDADKNKPQSPEVPYNAAEVL